MKKITLLICCLLFICFHSEAQWQLPVMLDDLNSWSSKPGFISYYNHDKNIPPGAGVFGNGIQMVLGGDERFGTQLLASTFADEMYFRRKVDVKWSDWNKFWHSGNLNPADFMQKKGLFIQDAGTVNSFRNGYTFAYATSGTPWNGALMSFGGLRELYDCQLSTDYGPNGGGHISFRTMNGDANPNTWNPWKEIYHDGNINRADVSFTCKDLRANGNLWATQIKVAVTNPWPDYVFEPAYEKLTLPELEKFIQTNKHLPEIPSAKTVAKDGVDLGDMNAKLLKKIEELTLYVIELKHEVDNLKKDKSQ